MKLVLASFAAFLIAACSSAPRTPEPQTGEKQIRDALRFDENRSGGKVRSLGNSRHLDELDYQSELVVTPDRDELRKIAGAPPSALPTLAAADSAELSALEALAHIAESADQRAQEAQAALASADEARSRGALDPATIEKTKSLLEAEASGRKALLAHVETIVRAQVLRSDPTLQGDELDVAIARRAEPFTPDELKIDLAKLQSLLREEIEGLSRQYEKDVRVAEGTTAGRPAFGFRLRAKLFSGDESAPVHVVNYDDQAESFSGKPPRVSFGSAADQERLGRELQAIQVILAVAQKTSSGELAVGERLRKLVDALREDLKRIEASFRADAGNGALSGLKSLLEQALADPATAEADKTGLKSLQSTLADAEAVLALATELAGGSGERSLNDWMSLTGKLSEAGRKVQSLLAPGTLASVKTGVEALADFAARKITTAGANPSIVQGTAADLRSLLADLRAQCGDLGLVSTTVLSRLTTKSVRNATAGLDAPTRTVSLDDVVPGTIRLNRTLADRGYDLDVTAELVRKKGEDYEVLQESTRSFRIDRFGLVSELSADAAFIRQEGESHFRTAPGAAWTLHYRLPDQDVDDAWTNTWQAIDAGIGVSVAGISTDSESFQPGVGLHLSFFHDVLKAGYGYNLGADSNRGYFFIGVGLFEAIEGVGNLFSGFGGKH
ncbi:MAG TPA: hypothetical protein VK843_13835 [Planctomycetota bacterium]|nr:hypothetical protein [Planctomycetota bacterium]